VFASPMVIEIMYIYRSLYDSIDVVRLGRLASTRERVIARTMKPLHHPSIHPCQPEENR